MNTDNAIRWRVFVDQALNADESIGLPKEASHHLCTVLRLKVGDSVMLFNGDGNDYPARLTSTGKSACVDILGVEKNNNESPVALELIQGISRGDRMDATLQKAVELGVTAIHPVMTEKSAVRLSGDRLQKKISHWKRIVISACEQSGRSRVPEVSQPMTLPAWLAQSHSDESSNANGSNWLLVPGASVSLGSIAPPEIPCRVLIGPESGLSQDEIRYCLAAGFTAASLGPRILRTETAGPTVLAILQTKFGDLQ